MQKTTRYSPILILCFLSIVVATQEGYSQGKQLTFDPGFFHFASEFGFYPLWDMQRHANQNLASGFQINRTSMDADICHFVNSESKAIISLLPANPEIIAKMGYFPDTSQQYIQSQYHTLDSLARIMGPGSVFWSLMPEYDQSGGDWVSVRKMSAASRAEAYRTWMDSYNSLFSPLDAYLAIDRSQRNVSLLALNAYSFSTAYSYKLGADVVLLERNNDEMGDMQTGISYVRGAARQYNRPWGIDISTWRAASQTPTSYDNNMNLAGGWSPSYFRRNMYQSYMAGANIVLLEGVQCFTGNTLNPLGQVVKEIADFTLTRHPRIGRPEATVALLMDSTNGFEPKSGRYCQGDQVWYQTISYTDGDYMSHLIFDYYFPGHWKSGTIPASAPSTPSAYCAALANGTDPRPWEPMGVSRWGDQVEVLHSDGPLDQLETYRTIIMLGTVRMNVSMKNSLQTWVAGGGTLVATSAQLSQADSALCGTVIGSQASTASQSKFVGNTSWTSEPQFEYRILTPRSAAVVASAVNGDVLLTRNSYGKGKVYLFAAPYLLSGGKTSMVASAITLLDTLMQHQLSAEVSGPFRVQYAVNSAPDTVIVSMTNNEAGAWTGKITLNHDWQDLSCFEWITDTPVAHRMVGGVATVDVTIPAYEMKIIAFIRSNSMGVRTGLPPASFSLEQNYPNPFNSSTRIEFTALARDHATLSVFNIIGQKIMTLLDEDVEPGHHAVQFEANGLASGVYICSLSTSTGEGRRSMVLLR